LDRDLVKAKSNIAAAEKRLDAERRKRTQSVVPPYSRTSRKHELGLVVRYGRVYQERHWDRIQSLSEPNLDDFVVLGESDGFLRITPKPYKGLPIEDNVDFAEGLRAMLSQYDRNEWHVCPAVWEDSFEKFLILKKQLIALGYDIRLLGIPEGEATYEGHVPNPQVQ
jgi:hypothetical protein